MVSYLAHHPDYRYPIKRIGDYGLFVGSLAPFPGWPASQYSLYGVHGNNVALRMFIRGNYEGYVSSGQYRLVYRPSASLLATPSGYLTLFYSPSLPSAELDSSNATSLGQSEVQLTLPPIAHDPVSGEAYLEFYINARVNPALVPVGAKGWMVAGLFLLVPTDPSSNLPSTFEPEGTVFIAITPFLTHMRHVTMGDSDNHTEWVLGGGPRITVSPSPPSPPASGPPVSGSSSLTAKRENPPWEAQCWPDTSSVADDTNLWLESLEFSTDEGSASARIVVNAQGSTITPPSIGSWVNPFALLPNVTYSFPLVVTSIAEEHEFDEDTRQVRLVRYTIDAQITAEMLTRAKICCEPCIYPFDPAEIRDRELRKQDKPFCLEEYLQLRKDSSGSRPPYSDIRNALEQVYEFPDGVPIFGRVPYVSPPEEGDTNWSGECSYSELLNRAFGWASFKQFVSPELRVLLVNGVGVPASSPNISAWGTPKEVRVLRGQEVKVDKITITTGPIPEDVELSPPSPPSSTPPEAGPDSGQECEGPTCTYYTIDTTPTTYTIVRIDKECDRVVHEEKKTYQYTALIVPDDYVANYSWPILCELWLLTTDTTEYQYVTQSCGALAKKVRKVVKDELITNLPDWVWGLQTNFLCDMLRKVYTAEYEEVRYAYDDKGCLREEITTGYSQSIGAVQFSQDSFGNLIVDVDFVFEPKYERIVHVHYGEGKWLHSKYGLGSRTPAYLLAGSVGFKPFGIGQGATLNTYGRTVVTNEEPQCYDCLGYGNKDNGGNQEQGSDSDCKLGSASASTGLGTKEYVRNNPSPAPTDSRVESILASVEMINSYWPIRLKGVKDTRDRVNAIISTNTPGKDPCTRQDISVARATDILDTINDVYDPAEPGYDWQSDAQTIANYLEAVAKFGDNRISYTFEGMLDRHFPYTDIHAGTWFQTPYGAYLAISTRVSINAEAITPGLRSYRYSFSVELMGD